MWFALLSFALAAEPEPPHALDTALQACLATKEGYSTDLGMIRCTDTSTKAWDAELNAAYKQLMGRLDESNAKLLKTAQRAWIAFRDADVEAIYAQSTQQEGTIWRLNASSRVLELTRTRALQLRNREGRRDDDVDILGSPRLAEQGAHHRARQHVGHADCFQDGHKPREEVSGVQGAPGAPSTR